MSNSDQQRRTIPQDMDILVRDLNDSGRTTFAMSLPSGSTRQLTVTWISNVRFFGRSNEELNMTVERIDRGPFCKKCKRQIEQLSCPPQEDSLLALINHARRIFLQCADCGLPAPSGEQHAMPLANEQDQPRVRLSSEAPENRIKLLPSGAPSESVETVSPQLEPAKVIKVKKQTNVPTSGTAGNRDVRTGEPRAAASHVYGAPSIRYELDAKSKVEVTIPHHICEEIVEHCKQSKRTRREVGGIIVGHNSESDRPGGGKFFQVTATDIIGIQSNDSSIAHFTMDHESWAKIQRLFEKKYNAQGKVRLGWFHTHPIQGIFFSPQDQDTHTVFTLPFQFAVVVDPRTMLAGLFAWTDYESRLLVESYHFPLQLQSETANRFQESNAEGGSAQESSPVSTWRMVLFFVMVATLVVYVTINSSFPMDPAYAILLIIAAFLGLRLWNANFFKPARLVELDVLRKVSDTIRYRQERPVRRSTDSRSFVTAVILIVAGMSVIFVFGYFVALWYNQPTSQPSPTFMSSPVPMTIDNRSEAPERKLVLNSYFENNKEILDIASINPSARVRYISRDRSSPWKPADGDEERQFFLRVFQVELRDPNTYVPLQESLNLGGSSHGSTATDESTEKLRNSFISHVKQLRQNRGLMQIQTQEGRKISLRIE